MQQLYWGHPMQPPPPPPRKGGVPTIVWILLAAFALPALAFGGCVVCVTASTVASDLEQRPKPVPSDSLAKSNAVLIGTCNEAVARLENVHVDVGENATTILPPLIADEDAGERACEAAGMKPQTERLHALRMDATRILAIVGRDPRSSGWSKVVGGLTLDPKTLHAKSIDKSDPSEVSYSYSVPSLSSTTLTVHGGDPTDWDVAIKSKRDVTTELSPSGGLEQLCTKGTGIWYAIQSGPLAGSFASVGQQSDVYGIYDVLVASYAGTAAEKARDEEKGAHHADSIKGYLCD